MSNSEPLPQVSVNDCNPVPVFNCHIALAKDAETGRISGRVANMPGPTAEGTSERDVLRSLSSQFKAAVKTKVDAGETVELIDSPKIENHEYQRFLPIHL